MPSKARLGVLEDSRSRGPRAVNPTPVQVYIPCFNWHESERYRGLVDTLLEHIVHIIRIIRTVSYSSILRCTCTTDVRSNQRYTCTPTFFGGTVYLWFKYFHFAALTAVVRSIQSCNGNVYKCHSSSSSCTPDPHRNYCISVNMCLVRYPPVTPPKGRGFNKENTTLGAQTHRPCRCLDDMTDKDRIHDTVQVCFKSDEQNFNHVCVIQR